MDVGGRGLELVPKSKPIRGNQENNWVVEFGEWTSELRNGLGGVREEEEGESEGGRERNEGREEERDEEEGGGGGF